jgi:4-amino-4-deoxy-L-arabinose transferase-like glycosyltransferase
VTRVPALTDTRGPAFWIGLTLVVGLFALPLFAGLDEPELSNDEAIYSCRRSILDTGHWLTPRAITTDAPFLEKPPLKFLITAGAMRAGVYRPTRDARSRRPVWRGGVRLRLPARAGSRGPACGVVATLVLFTFGSLVFEHGLRSNNMEAAVFLCYCGGIFHFTRWVDVQNGRASRSHAIALAACFVLGFMTKFVAALFLPLVCALALVWRPDGWAAPAPRGRDLALAAGVVLAATAPWFGTNRGSSARRSGEPSSGCTCFSASRPESIPRICSPGRTT